MRQYGGVLVAEAAVVGRRAQADLAARGAQAGVDDVLRGAAGRRRRGDRGGRRGGGRARRLRGGGRRHRGG